MKLKPPCPVDSGAPPRRNAMAVIVVLVLLSIVFLYIGAAARTLHVLGRDLNRIERQQIRRVVSWQIQTNAVLVTNIWTASLPSKNP